MRKWIGILAMLCLGQLFAQEADTTIYPVVEQPPLFPGCAEQAGPEAADRNKCTQQAILRFMYGNLVYPAEAVQDSIEGTVVLRFVVEKNGRIGKAEVLKDIGAGCADEALRVLDLLRNAEDANWTPGVNKGQVVRSFFTLPIKFKIPEPPVEPDYYLLGRDTIHVKWDTAANYTGGPEALNQVVKDQLKYPKKAAGTCTVGEIELQVLIAKDGRTYLVDILDYNDLGIDFWYEAIAVLNQHLNAWNPAMFKGNAVNSMYAFRVRFDPPETTCANRIEEYDRAFKISTEAAQLYEAGDSEAAIEKWNQAIGLAPNNAELLSYRGQAHMDAGNLSEACADFTAVKRILWVTWYESLLPLLCKADAKEEESKEEKPVEEGN